MMQGGLRAAQQVLGITAVHWGPGHANTGFEKQIATIDDEWCFDGLLYCVDQLPENGSAFNTRHQAGEFVCAETSNNRFLFDLRFTQHNQQPVSDCRKQLRSAFIVHRFIDKIKPVDIEKNNCRFPVGTTGSIDEQLKLIDQFKPVGQTRHWIDISQLVQFGSALHYSVFERLVGLAQSQISMPFGTKRGDELAAFDCVKWFFEEEEAMFGRNECAQIRRVRTKRAG